MTNVVCILCHNRMHISGEWTIYFENYTVESEEEDLIMPEIGVCDRCYKEAVVKKASANVKNEVREELQEEFLEAVAEKLEERIGDEKTYKIKDWNGEETIMDREEYLAEKIKD